MTNKRKLRTLTEVGLAAALLCVLSPISIPIGDVPLSLATLVVLLSSTVLGSWRSVCAVVVYIAIGCMGLPVFSGFTGGIGRLLGPTGGFLFGYLLLALVAGTGNTIPRRIIFMTLGTLALYAVGTVWYSLWTNVPLWSAAAVCVLPCIPIDAVKIAVAVVVGKRKFHK